MGCDFYINKDLNIEYKDGFYIKTEKCTINQKKYYMDGDGRYIHKQYKYSGFLDKEVYDSSEGWLITDKEKIKNYKQMIEENNISIENVQRIYISKEYMSSW